VTRRFRTPAAWLATLAIALHALWPLIAHAKPANALLVPVCSIEGTTHYVELQGSDTPLDKRSAAQHDHCKLCVFGAERLAVPAAQFPALPVAVAPDGVAVLHRVVLPAFQFVPPAQPRAPPHFS
jgi:hypothetical protein